MSERIYKRKTIGIACVGAQTKAHNGCALKGNLIKYVQEELCTGSIAEEHAKLYAICIYFLIKDKINDIKTLIICNDEDFDYVKEYLIFLLESTAPPNIINISELRKKLGRNINSLADNFAKCYRKRALNPRKWSKGKELSVVSVDFTMIKGCWEKLAKINN